MNAHKIEMDDAEIKRQINALKAKLKKNTPHKSITAEERYYHIRNHANLLEGTVFLRKEKDDKWYGSVAIRDNRDSPNKRIGRQVARRKYFNGKRVAVNTASYDEAEALFDDIFAEHAHNRGFKYF